MRGYENKDLLHKETEMSIKKGISWKNYTLIKANKILLNLKTNLQEKK